MNQLKPCRACEREVSTEAHECPHCGVPWPAPGGVAFWVQGLFLAISTVLLIYAFSILF